jgi:feruloyl esterase
MDKCDAADGVKDGVINDPLQCHFDPSVLLCKDGDAPDCLTAGPVRYIKSEYEGSVNPRTHALIVHGHEPGFEFFAGRFNVAPDKLKETKVGGPFFRSFVFENPDWDWTTMDFDKDMAFAEKKLGAIVDNYDPDLSKFKASGGKLLQYHGWADAQPSPMTTVDYFENVQKKVGDTQAFYRLFMIPGMGHCGGGPGTDQFEKMSILTDWVEHGKAPDSIVASHLTDGKVDRTRPLCSYPEVAKYKGTGSTDDAANFSCSKP